MICRVHKCEKYGYNPCCFLCKDEKECKASCKKDPSECGELEEIREAGVTDEED